MRSRILPVIGLSAIALAVATTFAPMASASHTGLSAAHKSATGVQTRSTAASCYSQADNDNGIGIVSQNFEASFDIYDSSGRDDFKLKKDCKVKKVHADGAYFNGSGPCDSFDVTFTGKGGGTGTYGYSGNYDIKIKPAVKLKAGKHTVSVVCNMNFSTGGEWGWNTNNTVRGKAGQWQNPGDGFSTGCTTYTTLTTCIASGEGGDWSFSIN